MPHRFLFPTPPPDSGSRMGPRKTTLSAHILTTIEVFDENTESSVQAIVKYIKSNGHKVTNELRFGLHVLRSLKLRITNGQVEQIKRSKNAKNKRRGVEKLRANQAEVKKINKKEKPVALDVSAGSSSPAKTVKNQSKAASKTKPKKIRKSMGTLSQTMAKPKVDIKAVKQLVAGKSKDSTKDLGEDIDANMLEPQATLKPQMVSKGKDTRK